MIVESKKAGEILVVGIRLGGAMGGYEKEGVLISIRPQIERQNRLGIREVCLGAGYGIKNKRNRRSQNWVKNYTLEVNMK